MARVENISRAYICIFATWYYAHASLLVPPTSNQLFTLHLASHLSSLFKPLTFILPLPNQLIFQQVSSFPLLSNSSTVFLSSGASRLFLPPLFPSF
jgi:hypothetical protein